MASPLTDRQRAIYEFLLKTIREKGFAPSIPEIGRRFRIASTNGVSDHLKALEKKGYIRRVGKRAIEIVNQFGRSPPPGKCRCWAGCPPASRFSARKTSKARSPFPTTSAAASALRCRSKATA